MEFIPKDQYGSAIGYATGGGTMQAAPEIILPTVGDTMKVVAYPWGRYEVFIEGMTPPVSSKVIELEVKAIKQVKVIYE